MAEPHAYTTDDARDAAARGELASWVAEFLGSPGSDNAALAELLSDPPRHWLGPVLLPIDQLHRLVGPPGAPVLQEVQDHEWRDDVEELAGRIQEGHEAPPVVVSYRDDQLVLEDGNHRVEALRRAGAVEAWSVVAFDTEGERDAFVARSERVEGS